MGNLARDLTWSLPAGGENRGRLRAAKHLSTVDIETMRASHNEEIRWAGYLASLYGNPATTPLQTEAILRIWNRVWEKYPGIRHPSVGLDEDGSCHLTWAFADDPDMTFAVEIGPDGIISWFFTDRIRGQVEGTEDEGARSLPDEAYQWLEHWSR